MARAEGAASIGPNTKCVCARARCSTAKRRRGLRETLESANFRLGDGPAKLYHIGVLVLEIITAEEMTLRYLIRKFGARVAVFEAEPVVRVLIRAKLYTNMFCECVRRTRANE